VGARDRHVSDPALQPIDETAAPVAPPRDESGEVRGRALRGSVWTLVGHAFNNAVRLGSNLILTRLLFPEYFGVMALVNIFLQGLHMFSDVGIGTSIIQHARGEDPAFVNTAWTVQALRGVYLFLVSCVLGWPLAWFYEIPDLVWMVPIAGSTALLDGLTSTSLFTQNRTLTLGKLTLLESAATLAGSLTNVAVAYATRSILALLVGGLAAGLVRLILSHVYLPGIRNRFAWEADARKDLLGFGRWVFLSTAVTFVALQIDRLVLGKLVSVEELGVYSIALMLAAIPREIVSQLAQRVYYPVVAREIRERPASPLVRALRQKLVWLLVVPVACTMGVALPVITFLYDDRYTLAGPLMAWLTLGTWLSILESTYGAIALAFGEPKWITYGTVTKTLIFGAAVAPVFATWGIEGVAILVSLSTLALVFTNAWAVHRRALASLPVDVGATIAMLALALGAYHLHGLITHLTGLSLVGIVVLAALAIGVPGALLATGRVKLL
jgi:O-antigen/teichoic acid export membrane protein